MNKALESLMGLKKQLEDASDKVEKASAEDAKFREAIINRISSIESFLSQKFGYEQNFNSGEK